MRPYGRDTALAVSLFIALSISPAVLQEGLDSLWAWWGVPLLWAAGVFAVFSGIIFGTPAVAGIFSRGGAVAKKSRQVSQGGEGGGEEQEPEGSGETIRIGPDAVLADALSELDPGNFMDLARALQEMGRDADALEVLALVVEAEEGEYGAEVAEALRRMRQKLEPDNSGSA